MRLKELQDCIIGRGANKRDDIAAFNKLITQADPQERSAILFNSELLYNAAMHGAIKIVTRLLEFPESQIMIVQLDSDEKIYGLKIFLAAVGRNVIVTNKLLEQPPIFAAAKANLVLVLRAAARNKIDPNILNRIFEVFPESESYINTDYESIFRSAHTVVNIENIMQMLEYPAMYEYVNLKFEPQNKSYELYIHRFSEYYFPKLQKRLTDFKRKFPSRVFDMSERETNLCFAILRNLLRSYADREAIKRSIQSIITQEKRSLRSNTLFFRAQTYIEDSRHKHFPDKTNIHLARVTLLLSLNSLRLIADKNENELLRLAVNIEQQPEIAAMLRGISCVRNSEAARPLDTIYQSADPLDTIHHPRLYFSIELAEPYLNKQREIMLQDVPESSKQRLKNDTDLTCPISLKIFVDPVRIRNHPQKFVFERSYLEVWITSNNPTNPLNRAPCKLEDLEPALDIKNLIAQKIANIIQKPRPMLAFVG